jgi:predicted DNA-binding transcriptional regulator AlpA
MNDENGNTRKQWSSKSQLAARYKISTRTIDRMRKRGQFPPPDIQIGDRMVRWNDETVEKFLAERTGDTIRRGGCNPGDGECDG